MSFVDPHRFKQLIDHNHSRWEGTLAGCRSFFPEDVPAMAML
jgi:hypothetical protein